MVEAETVKVASPPSLILAGDTLILMRGVEEAGVGVGVAIGAGVEVGLAAAVEAGTL